MISQVVLGTVQLGLPYGRRRSLEAMPEPMAFGILDAAWEAGIRAFDTAEAYGVSASRVRRWSEARGNADMLEIVTKVAVGSPGLTAEALERSADAALDRFEGTSRLTILSHGSAAPDEWRAIVAAGRKHSAATGQSVYTADEVRAALALPFVERIQAPGNILDMRAMSARADSVAKLDVRSVYLQGILLEHPERAEERAPGSGKFVAKIQSLAASLGTGLAPLLLATMLAAIRDGDRVVVGVDSVEELVSIPAALEVPADIVQTFATATEPIARDPEVEGFLDPREWTPRIVH